MVDDLASDTQLLKRYLEGTENYLVREENDPEAALSAALEFRPHLILLDLMMPDMDGGELASLFRANPSLKNVPIVFLTAKVTKEEAELFGGRIGEYPFLAKPIVLTEVAACLDRNLSASNLL